MQYVSTIGFPIAVAGYLLIYVMKELKEHNKKTEEFCNKLTALDTYVRAKLDGGGK
jgi:hypothetical protein